MTKKQIIKSCLLAIAISIFSWQLRALPEFMRVYAADPLAKSELKSSCATCHTNPAGGGARNDFGNAFGANGYKINDALRQKFPAYFNVSDNAPTADVPVTFVKDSDYQALVEINGKKYLIDTKTRTVKEFQAETKLAVVTPIQKNKPVPPEEEDKVYQQMDVRLINLPTAKPMPKGALVGDFTHRFPFGEYSPKDGTGLFGLDGFAVPSFGFAYGVTDRIHIGGYRSSDAVGKPIAFYAGVGLADENKGHPLSAMARIGVEGRDNFQRNFTTSIELAVARSITHRAQVYFVPTISFNNRPYGPTTRNLPGETTFAMGIGAAVNIRPLIALLGEVNWRVNEKGQFNSTAPVYGFGIEKVTISRRHAFGLVFTNGGGTTMGQRSGTRRSLLGPGTDQADLTIGFNISRRIF